MVSAEALSPTIPVTGSPGKAFIRAKLSSVIPKSNGINNASLLAMYRSIFFYLQSILCDIIININLEGIQFSINSSVIYYENQMSFSAGRVLDVKY
jgi:hypothetical protein